MMPLLRVLPPFLILGGTWGLTPALAKRLMQAGWEPLALATVAGAISTAVLLAVCLARGAPPPVSRPYLVHYAAAGVIGFAAANLFAFTGLRHAPAGLFALLVPLAPLLTVLLSAAFGMERPTRRRLLGTALGLAGMALAMAPGAALPDLALLPWALLMALTPACYALSNVLAIGLAPRGAQPLPVAAGTVAAATLCLAIFALAAGQARLPPPTPVSLLLLLQGGLIALAYLVYFRTIARLGPVVTSQVGYLITLTGLAWGYLLFGEVPGWLTLPAAALVFAGIALVTLSPRGASAPSR
jgi:drug/metabolite transporter (DMT)-like permease